MQPARFGAHIDEHLYQNLQELLEQQTISHAREETEIDLWLDSPGGDAHVAFQIGLLLRSYAASIQVVIPERARSATTLLAVAADRIYMGASAELGPLDAQIPNADLPPLSALDVSRSASRTRELALELTMKSIELIRDQTMVSTAEAIQASVELTARMYAPVIGASPTTAILEAENLIDLTIQYADELLARRKADTEDDLHEAIGLIKIRDLVNGFRHHDYVIDAAQADELIGLPVFGLDLYDPVTPDTERRSQAKQVVALRRHLYRHGLSKLDVRQYPTDERGDGGRGGEPVPPDPSPSLAMLPRGDRPPEPQDAVTDLIRAEEHREVSLGAVTHRPPGPRGPTARHLVPDRLLMDTVFPLPRQRG